MLSERDLDSSTAEDFTQKLESYSYQMKYYDIFKGLVILMIAEDLEGDEEGMAELWPSIWYLPAALAPAGDYVPNRNLLGWFPISPGYTREMAAIMERHVEADYDVGTSEIQFIIYMEYPFSVTSLNMSPKFYPW